MSPFSRRSFLGGAAALTASMAPLRLLAETAHFKVGVISDEISQDFDHACHVIRNEYGLRFVEMREMWGKNLQASTDAELQQAQTILAKYGLTATDIASPLFKVDWPDAPRSPYSSEEGLHGAAVSSLSQQDDVLRRSIELAHRFKTNKVRCFDFWRIEDVQPYRKAINEKLQEAATFAGARGVMLVLENEFACNTATGREAAATLAGVPSRHLALNWDPGNAVMRGELDAYPNGWNALPKERIHHCHVKNAQKDTNGKMQWAPVDIGYVDWTAQFRALKKIDYSDATNLETHWRGGGTPEQSSDRSWQGMKRALTAAGCI